MVNMVEHQHQLMKKLPEFEALKKQYKDIAKSDEDVLSIALFGDVAIKFIEQRNEDAIPTLIRVEA